MASQDPVATNAKRGDSEQVDRDVAGGDVRDDGRRAFIGRSGKLLIYTPPLIQLFIPTKALAATPSSGV